METRTILGVVFGATVAAAAIGQERAPRPAPAAGLYQLALTEWRACRDKGLQLPNELSPPHRLTRIAGRAVITPATEPPADPTELWRQIAAPTAVARELLVQAAAAPTGDHTFDPISNAHATLALLAELTQTLEAIARLDLVEQPAAAAHTALLLLRHSRHLGSATEMAFLHASFDAAHRASVLLADALAVMPQGEANGALLDRCEAELDRHLVSRLHRASLQQLLLAGVEPRLESHRPRLRDMHQTEAGGYDEAAMRRRIAEELQRLFATCDERGDGSAEAWKHVLLLHIDELATPANSADDVTTKAARGMAHLTLCGLRPILEHEQECLVAVRAGRDALLRARGSPGGGEVSGR